MLNWDLSEHRETFSLSMKLCIYIILHSKGPTELSIGKTCFWIASLLLEKKDKIFLFQLLKNGSKNKSVPFIFVFSVCLDYCVTFDPAALATFPQQAAGWWKLGAAELFPDCCVGWREELRNLYLNMSTE